MDELVDTIAACSPSPRLELFARHLRQGWYQWGNQLGQHLQTGYHAPGSPTQLIRPTGHRITLYGPSIQAMDCAAFFAGVLELNELKYRIMAPDPRQLLPNTGFRNPKILVLVIVAIIGSAGLMIAACIVSDRTVNR